MTTLSNHNCTDEVPKHGLRIIYFPHSNDTCVRACLGRTCRWIRVVKWRRNKTKPEGENTRWKSIASFLPSNLRLLNRFVYHREGWQSMLCTVHYTLLNIYNYIYIYIYIYIIIYIYIYIWTKPREGPWARCVGVWTVRCVQDNSFFPPSSSNPR